MSERFEQPPRRDDEALMDLPPSERVDYVELVERLRERPLPSGHLRARIRASISARATPRPTLRLAFAYIACGGVLLSVAAVGLAGVGPLSA
jgi:hypothetical protein